jgi:hypothetical protein
LRKRHDKKLYSQKTVEDLTNYEKCLSLLQVAVLVGFISSAQSAAVTINWTSAQNITGDSDVSTTGSLLYAYNLGDTGVADTTVNGVTFTSGPLSASGNSVSFGQTTLNETPGYLYANNALGTLSGAFSSLSSSYKSLLGSGIYADNPVTMTLSLGGLTSGQDYQFQWWLNNSKRVDSNVSDGTLFRTTAGNNPYTVGLNANTTAVTGGLGQYAIATFTANSSTFNINFNGTDGSNVPMINAFQLRAVPEPSTYALFGLGALGLVIAYRRRAA